MNKSSSGPSNLDEFSVIRNFFTERARKRADVKVGIGDDAAIVMPSVGEELVITADTLIAGIHFPEETAAFDIGHKSLAVNLSDLAAMGASPAWVTLALTLPDADRTWLQAFGDGFFALADRYNVALIGGDLTRGALTITVQAMGFSPPGTPLLRSSAMPKDRIYVTGSLGDAGLALAYLQSKIKITANDLLEPLEKLNRPEPRIAMGEHLRGVAHAAIDISDGLVADLGHILEQSKVGAIVNVDQLPLSHSLTQAVTPELAIMFALTSGDDYELCFTVPKEKCDLLETQLGALGCRYTCIGEITRRSGLKLQHQDGSPYHGPTYGYQHF